MNVQGLVKIFNLLENPDAFSYPQSRSFKNSRLPQSSQNICWLNVHVREFLVVNVCQSAGSVPQQVKNRLLIEGRVDHVAREPALGDFVAEGAAIAEFALDLNTHFNGEQIDCCLEFDQELAARPRIIFAGSFRTSQLITCCKRCRNDFDRRRASFIKFLCFLGSRKSLEIRLTKMSR